MYLAYFDESGDSGLTNSRTKTFCLSCVLIHEKDWVKTLSDIKAFRLHLLKKYGIPRNCELKGDGLFNNKHGIRALNLSFKKRMAIYKLSMKFQAILGVFTTFSIVINKPVIRIRTKNVWEIAWQYAIQRLERFGTEKGENIHIITDEGHEDHLRRLVRFLRRSNIVPSAYQPGTVLQCNAEMLIEDPSFRNSKISHFVQLADLNAYASFRKVFPHPLFGEKYWNYLGKSRLMEVNRLTGGLEGIVLWP